MVQSVGKFQPIRHLVEEALDPPQMVPVCVFVCKLLMSACCVCVGFKTVFGNPPSGQSVRRAAGTECTRSLQHSHRNQVSEPRWTARLRLSPHLDPHAATPITQRQVRDSVMILWYFPGIQVQVEVKFYRWTTPGSVFMDGNDSVSRAQWQRRSASECAAAAYKSCQAADICCAPRFLRHKTDESGKASPWMFACFCFCR